jgi:hypothetical protein
MPVKGAKMPKKFSIADKKEWLKKYEHGKSEVSIAKGKCDVRTVKKGIEEARREQEAQIARAELLKHALLKHQDSLMESLRGILSALTLPSEDWEPLSWYHNGDSIFSQDKITIASTQPKDSSEGIQDTDSETATVQSMLKQHLKNDKLWKYLAQREKAYEAHRSKRIALQLRVRELLEEETGCPMVDRNVDQRDSVIKPPFLYSYTAGELFFKMALRHAFSDHITYKWQDDIVADPTAGCVRDRLGGVVLAEVPGEEKVCRQKLLDAFNKMKGLPEIKEVASSFGDLERTTSRARQAVKEVLTLELITGRCNVCRRLGM